MSKSRTLHALIRGAYSRLSEADRRVADLILNFPGGLPGYSGSDLARMASTSNATVSRFVRKLGFADFEEMRRRARAEMESGTPVYLIGRSTIEGEGDLPGSTCGDRHRQYPALGRIDRPGGFRSDDRSCRIGPARLDRRLQARLCNCQLFALVARPCPKRSAPSGIRRYAGGAPCRYVFRRCSHRACIQAPRSRNCGAMPVRRGQKSRRRGS